MEATNMDARFVLITIVYFSLVVSLTLACEEADERDREFDDYGILEQNDDANTDEYYAKTKPSGKGGGNSTCKGYLCKWHKNCGTAKLNRESSGAKLRITNARTAKYGHWPSFARIKHRDKADGFCGGVLISDRHVLTAAHCVVGMDWGNTEVTLGDHNKKRSDQYEQRFTLESSCVAYKWHKSWSSDRKQFNAIHDWAVLTLSKPAKLSDYVEPACLSGRKVVSKSCYALGMGLSFYLAEEHKIYPDEVQVLTMNKVKCSTYYPWISSSDASRICWDGKYRNGMPCHGDSGGPILCLDNGRSPARWTVAGTLSHGALTGYCDGLTQSKWVSVFANIPNLVTDIKNECGL